MQYATWSNSLHDKAELTRGATAEAAPSSGPSIAVSPSTVPVAAPATAVPASGPGLPLPEAGPAPVPAALSPGAAGDYILCSSVVILG